MEVFMDSEISAMSTIAAALDTVKADADALKRVLRWAVERYAPGDIKLLAPKPARQSSAGSSETGSEDAAQNGSEYADVAELFDAASPKSEWQKAIVVGHWLMTGEGKSEFAGGDVNAHLKNLGHGVGNITDALNKAIRQKPALVIQTGKSGSSKQARKTYKLTRAGVSAVEAMLAGANAAGSDVE
jgi:hypothetical protein